MLRTVIIGLLGLIAFPIHASLITTDFTAAITSSTNSTRMVGDILLFSATYDNKGIVTWVYGDGLNGVGEFGLGDDAVIREDLIENYPSYTFLSVVEIVSGDFGKTHTGRAWDSYDSSWSSAVNDSLGRISFSVLQDDWYFFAHWDQGDGLGNYGSLYYYYCDRGGCGVEISNFDFRVAEIPVPNTLFLLGFGIFGLGGVRGRSIYWHKGEGKVVNMPTLVL